MRFVVSILFSLAGYVLIGEFRVGFGVALMIVSYGVWMGQGSRKLPRTDAGESQ